MKMNKKEFRKELELALTKAIVDVLDKRDPRATKEITKSIHNSSKAIAKKFHKALKPKEKIVKPVVAAPKAPAVKNKVVTKSKAAPKKPAVKIKKPTRKK
jgi:hypothetical protein